MKRILLATLLIAVLALTSGTSVFAQDNEPAPGATCGEYFGLHVEEHALAGHLGAEHNPGMHEGLAGFDDHEDAEHSCPE